MFELRNAISNSSYLNRENRETSSVQFPIVPRKETRESQRFVHGSAEAEGFLSLKKLGNPYPRLSAPDAFDDSEAVPKIYIFPALPHVMFLRRGLRERYLAITALCMPRPNLAIQSLVSNLGSDLRILRECRASDIRKADKERIFVATARALPDTFIVTATLHRLTREAGQVNPSVAYQLMVDLFILPLARMHKRLGFTQLVLFLPRVDVAQSEIQNRRLLGASKRAVRAIYRKRAAASVDFLENGNIMDTFFFVGRLVAWAVHRSYNSDERKWMSIFEQELK